MLKQGQKLPPTGSNMQGFLRTPWNATSHTTGQDALWQHILDRNTSSQPFMTPCARQVMNRIPRKCNTSMSRVLRATPLMLSERSNILTSTEKPTTSKANPWTEAPLHPGKVTPCPVWHLTAIWNHIHIEDFCGFQWRDMDAVTPEFPLDLHNTSLENFRHPQLGI